LFFQIKVINALAKSGEPGAAARAERVLHNMVKRHRQGGMNDDVKPTTINFNTVLDAVSDSLEHILVSIIQIYHFS